MLISMDPKIGEGLLGVLKDTDILLIGYQIAEVGKNIPAPGAYIIDAKGKIVMPGFVDVHNHLWQSMIRGCGPDSDLMEWLGRCVFPLKKAGITKAEAYSSVKHSTVDLIHTGVTTVVDDSHSFNPGFVEGNLQALTDSGLSFSFAYCRKKDSGPHMQRMKTEFIDSNPRAMFQVCSHPSMNNLELLTLAAAQARKMQVPLNLHLAENYKQSKELHMQAMKLAEGFRSP